MKVLALLASTYAMTEVTDAGASAFDMGDMSDMMNNMGSDMNHMANAAGKMMNDESGIMNMGAKMLGADGTCPTALRTDPPVVGNVCVSSIANCGCGDGNGCLTTVIGVGGCVTR